MPELPEVETVARDLHEHLSGAVLRALEVLDAKVWQGAEPPTRLRGRTLRAVHRRAKFLVYDYGGPVLVQHLRMTGKMLPADSPQIPADRRATRQIRARFRFDRGDVLFFDPRRFGTLEVYTDAAAAFAGRDLAPEPFAADGGAAARTRLVERLGRTGRAVKAALLDQSVVCGVGNIYADEALFRSGLDPRRAAHTLSQAQVETLFAHLQAVMGEAIAKRGTSMSDYLDLSGNPGVFKRYLAVYRRAGEPCRCCGAPIERLVVAGRGSHVCRHCQPSGRRRPRGSCAKAVHGAQ